MEYTTSTSSMQGNNNEMKKISVIIPIYNTVNELTKCLSSVQKQTYPNLEVICVDDGSSDGSQIIADEFAEVDNRFIVVHQANAGESNARNEGLKRATGDYIAFCDCDDWIDLDMYESMLSIAEENNLDLIAASWYKEAEETKEIVNRFPVNEGIFGRDELLYYLYKRDDYRGFAYMWDKLYRKEILEGIVFDESLKLGGDVLYLAQAALNVQRAMYMNRCVYHYNQRKVSGCHTKDLQKWKDWICAYTKTISLFEKEKVSPEVISYVKRFLAYHSSNAAEIAMEQRDAEAVDYFQNYMRQYHNEYTLLNKEYPERIKRYIRIMEEYI